MTPQEKMQAVVEAAGECWHEEYNGQYAWTCPCEASRPDNCTNPSPTDLNELFRLAEKMDARFVVRRLANEMYVSILRCHNQDGYGVWTAETPAEALLDALYQSLNAKEVK